MADTDLDDERTEELATLQSIYPELVIDSTSPCKAHLDILIAPTKPLPVTFVPSDQIERLAYLPPLHVDILLPQGYPNDAPPQLQLGTNLPWLPPAVIDRLVNHGRLLWEEYGGGAMLFSFISSLQEAAETAFELTELTVPSSMLEDLVEYNRRMTRELFDKETFDCEVCLEPKKGSSCYRMQRCSHVFCRSCLQDYYNNCIEEGEVNNVKCMSTECGNSGNTGPGRRKKDRLLSPKELLQIPLSRETVQRYANLKRKKKIESDPSIIFCPRIWCQGAMRTKKYPKLPDVAEMDESDSEAEETPVAQEQEQEKNGTGAARVPEKRRVGTSGSERLAICEDCNLAFCTMCLASWHGDFVRCEPRDKDQLTEEDHASLNFIMKNTSPCPYCSVPCQKSFGCNHMTCTQCKTHFCYICAAWLNPDHPYSHFNDKRNKLCFRRLMDMAEGDMANDVQFGGRRGAEQMAEFWEQEAMRLQEAINAEE